MAVSFQCMTKFTTNKKEKKKTTHQKQKKQQNKTKQNKKSRVYITFYTYGFPKTNRRCISTRERMRKTHSKA